MDNVKPGDLAYIVGLQGPYAANNGHIVEVLRLHRKEGVFWVVKPCTMLVAFRESEGVIMINSEGTIRDKYLRRITPGELDEIVEKEKELEIAK